MTRFTGSRFVYAFYKTRERAEESLEDSYAEGDVSPGDDPRIERRVDHRGRVVGYAITLPA